MERMKNKCRSLYRQRGGVVIWFALLLPVLLGFAALAVDLARLYMIRVELHNAADAAALAGARSLADPQESSASSVVSLPWQMSPSPFDFWSFQATADSSDEPYNWAAASAKALEFARQNVANGSHIEDAVIETGYWNLQNPALDLRSPLTSGLPGTGDVPAVRATITISATQNDGPVQFFFAPILGIDESSLQASAVAVIAPPAASTNLFPFVLTSSIFNPAWWDTTANKPKIDPDTGAPYVIKINLSSFYPNGGEGTWTSLTYEIGQGSSNNKDIGKIIKSITDGVQLPEVAVGDDIWTGTGTMQDLYQDKQYPLPIGEDIAVPIVTSIEPGEWQRVVAIAGFHLDGVGGNGNKSYLYGHFIEPTIIPGLKPGDGTGTPLGAYTPPLLVY